MMFWKARQFIFIHYKGLFHLSILMIYLFLVDSTEAVIPDVVGEMPEEGATIIIRNQTAYQNKPQVAKY